MLQSIKIHSSWDKFITPDIEKEIIDIQSLIGEDYTPTDKALILRFLQIDLMKTKVVWLGQDVYPAKDVATGRSFEVGSLKSWLEPFRQVSLKNIIRAIYKSEKEITTYDAIPTYAIIKKEISKGHFKLLRPADWFSSLENQGVLFLNTSFTCEINRPNSHKAIWQSFSRKVLSYISEEQPNIKWFLWGREAQSNKEFITSGEFFESRHPSRVSSMNKDDFLRFTGFEETKNIINWLG